jgi:asparagine synthase (glutamine-hydrolysing)
LSAVFGIIGPAERPELEAMGERMAHKGLHCVVWSPAPDVWFGEVRNTPRPENADPSVAFSGQLYRDWRMSPDGPQSPTTYAERDLAQRELAARFVASKPESFAHDIDGHFAVAHRDSMTGEIRLTTDRINYENIFYTKTDRRFVFASEYKALLALDDFSLTVNPDAMQYSIATMLPNFRGSLCAGVERVTYGHTLTVGPSGEMLTRYFQPRCVPEAGSLEHFATGLRERLSFEVEKLFAHHERIAVTMGGGLDSASLLAVIRSCFPDRQIATYSIGVSRDDPELVGARIAADHFSTEHHEYVFDPRSLADDLPKLVWLTEEYASREESLLQYQVESQIVGREPVIAGGHGADMIFAGMPRHRLIRLGEILPFARHAFTEVYQRTQSGLAPRSLLGTLGSALLFRGQFIPPPMIAGSSGPSRVHEPKNVCDMLDNLVGGFHPFHYHAAIYSLGPIDAIMPFMTRSIMEYSMRIPTRYKVGAFRQKMVLRSALQSMLPDSITRRRKAIQRARPDTKLSDALDDLAARVLSHGDIVRRGLIDLDYAKRVLTRPKDGVYKRDQLTRVWMLICSELWCRSFLDQRGIPTDFSLGNLRATSPKDLVNDAYGVASTERDWATSNSSAFRTRVDEL